MSIIKAGIVTHKSGSTEKEERGDNPVSGGEGFPSLPAVVEKLEVGTT